jgi:CspA family cold shock protein
MSLIAKLSISLVITVIAAVLTTILLQGATIHSILDWRLVIAFFIATAATAIITGRTASPTARSVTTSNGGSQKPAPADSDGARENGTVKWFNVSKGFGFIVKDDDEEIFVHFRSIRGEGRRSLRDGQSVSFIVSQSDKGPQAEDVVGED